MRDKPNVNITLHLIRLKIELDKEHICLLFYQKKSAADAYRTIYETYDENVITVRTCAN